MATTIKVTKVGGSTPDTIPASDFFNAARAAKGVNGTLVINGFPYLLSTLDFVAGAASDLPLNAVFVDATYGDDATGAKYNAAKPFETIIAAEAVANSGELIVIYPGTYTDNGLGKDGVRYHFLNGATINTTNHIFTDTEGAITISVSGEGSFITTTSLLHFSNASSKAYIKGRSVQHANGPAFTSLGGGAQIYAAFSETITATGDNGTVYFEGDNNLCLIAADYITTGASLTFFSGTNNNTLYGYAKEWYVNNPTNAFSGIVVNTGGYIEIHGKIKHNAPANNAQGAIFHTGAGASKTVIYGDIEVIAGGMVVHCNSANGIIEIYGKISGTGIVKIADGVVNIYNDVTSSLASNPVIEAAGGILLVRNGRIKNTSDTATAAGINISGTARVILDNAKIVTTNAASESLTAPGAVNIKVYSAFSNKAKNANVTVTIGTLTVNDSVE